MHPNEMRSLRAMRRFTAGACGALVLAAHLAAVRWDWYSASELAGGGYFYSGRQESTGGLFSMTAIPAFTVSDRLSVVPFYAFEYRGVRDIRELLGGGTLVQQSVTNTAYVKPVFIVAERWKLKPRVGYTGQLLRETQDEEWGAGLFDYARTAVALELERTWGDRARVVVSPGVFAIRFPNYQSIAVSRYGLELSTAGPGRTVLDFTGYELAVDGRTPFPGGEASAAVYLLQRLFADQYVVTATGEFSRDTRADLAATAQLTAMWAVRPTGPLSLALRAGMDLGYLASNQNHYDVARMRFVPDYYGYLEGTLRPGVTVGLNRLRLTVDVDYALGGRLYTGRYAQDQQGNYGDDRVNIATHLFRTAVRFPLVHGIEGFVSQAYLASVANTHFEQTYAYNYTVYHVLCGVRYGR